MAGSVANGTHCINLGNCVRIHLMLYIRYFERIMIDVINVKCTKSEVSSTLCPI